MECLTASMVQDDDDSQRLKYASHSSVEVHGTEEEEQEDFEEGLTFVATDPLAASTDVLQAPDTSGDEDNIFDCGICQDRLVAPKALPCLHNFCLKCLDQYAKTLSIQDLNTGDSVFQCPLCRAKTRVPNEGVKEFPTNFHVARLQEQKRSLDVGFTLREAIEYLEEREDEIVEILQERKRKTQVDISNQRDAMVNKIDIYMDALHGKVREQFYIDSQKAMDSLHRVKARLEELGTQVAGGRSESVPDLKDTASIVRLKEHAETVAKVANELESLRVTANSEQEKLLDKRLVFVAAEGFKEYEVRHSFGYVKEQTGPEVSPLTSEDGVTNLTSWGQLIIALLPAVVFVLVMKLYDAALDVTED